MKNHAPYFVAIASVFCISCFAQRNVRVPANVKAMNVQQQMPENRSDDDLAVVSYHVEERINMAFGSNVTTYDVSSLSLVGTNDLGENNVRIVTPKYAKVRKPVTVLATSPAAPVVQKLQPTAYIDVKAIVPAVKPLPLDAPAVEEKQKYARIDILNTYERILEKGYKSVDMLKRVANSRYFDGDLVIAAKWYSQLFSMSSDLEGVYYYRYAQSLKAVKQFDKAKEMMAVFENQNL